MATIGIQVGDGSLTTYIATPTSAGPWPGVVVIHDALGMSADLRRQADWLASEGYLAAAPDLFGGTHLFGCLFTVMRDFQRGHGPIFDRVEAARQWLIQHESSTGKVGVIGFCFGGSFALTLAPTGDYNVASVNYGSLTRAIEEKLPQACPIVGSYGALDRGNKGEAARLEQILSDAGIAHDIKEYPDADHAFMNDHRGVKMPVVIEIISRVFGGGEYHAEANQDARRRITAFFKEHLTAQP